MTENLSNLNSVKREEKRAVSDVSNVILDTLNEVYTRYTRDIQARKDK